MEYAERFRSTVERNGRAKIVGGVQTIPFSRLIKAAGLPANLCRQITLRGIVDRAEVEEQISPDEVVFVRAMVAAQGGLRPAQALVGREVVSFISETPNGYRAARLVMSGNSTVYPLFIVGALNTPEAKQLIQQMDQHSGHQESDPFAGE